MSDLNRERLLAQFKGWNGIDALTSGAPMAAPAVAHIASHDVRQSLAILHQNAATRPVIDWLLANTASAPPPPRADTFEATALLAARHNERQLLGEDILSAIADGYALLHPAAPQDPLFTPHNGDFKNDDETFNDGFRMG